MCQHCGILRLIMTFIFVGLPRHCTHLNLSMNEQVYVGCAVPVHGTAMPIVVPRRCLLTLPSQGFYSCVT